MPTRPLFGVLLIVTTLAMACGAPAVDSEPAPPASPDQLRPVELPPRYPDPPYGLQRGEVFPNLKLEGYREGRAQWTTIEVGDYYDPEGTRGVNALHIDVGAPWCATSLLLGKQLPRITLDTFERGARFLTVLMEDRAREPATRATADEWLARFAPTHDLTVGAGKQTLPGGGALPTTYLINPRTMRILRVGNGLNAEGTEVPGLESLLTVNAAPP